MAIFRNRFLAFAILFACCLCFTLRASAATWYVAKSGNDVNSGTSLEEAFLTIQKGVDSAFAGDNILVAEGHYAEDVLSERSGTAGNPIVLDGQNVASMATIAIDNEYLTIQNMTFTEITPDTFYVIYLLKGAHYTTISNNLFDINLQRGVGYCVRWFSPYPAELPFGTNCASGCLVVSNTFQGLAGAVAICTYGNTNIIFGNTIQNNDAADCLYVWGRNHLIMGNTFSNTYIGGEVPNHADWLQSFDNNGHGASNILITSNIVADFSSEAQMGMLSTFTWIISDFTIRNNLFIRNARPFMNEGVENLKFHNNTFYECITNAGVPILIGPSWFSKFSNFDPDFCPKYELLTNEIFSGDILDDSLQPRDERANYIVKGSGAIIDYNGTNFANNMTFFGASGVSNFTVVSGSPAVWRRLPKYADGAQVLNNVFLNCGGGSTNEGWYEVYESLTNVVADYNFISIFGGIPRLADPPAAVGDPAGWDKDRWYETNGLIGGDPRFADPDNLDVHPQTGSVLLGAGLDLSSLFTTDFYGNDRTNSWTIGAAQNSTNVYASVFSSYPHLWVVRERICKPITNTLHTNFSFYVWQGGDTNNEMTYGITQDSNWIDFTFTNGTLNAEYDTNAAWLVEPFFEYATNWPTWSAGNYTNRIIINGYTNSVLCNTRTIPFTLILTNPILKCYRTKFELTSTEGDNVPNTNYTVYTSDGETSFTYTNEVSDSWIISSTNGSVSSGTNTIIVGFDTGALSPDDYHGYITNIGCGLESFYSTQLVDVYLTVSANGGEPPAATNIIHQTWSGSAFFRGRIEFQ